MVTEPRLDAWPPNGWWSNRVVALICWGTPPLDRGSGTYQPGAAATPHHRAGPIAARRTRRSTMSAAHWGTFTKPMDFHEILSIGENAMKSRGMQIWDTSG